jgi:hypothetical protein
MMRPDELERQLRERLDALGPAPRAELLHVLMLPDFERADRIGEFWSYPESRTFAELLIECEEDRTLRARGTSEWVLVRSAVASQPRATTSRLDPVGRTAASRATSAAASPFTIQIKSTRANQGPPSRSRESVGR